MTDPTPAGSTLPAVGGEHDDPHGYIGDRDAYLAACGGSRARPAACSGWSRRTPATSTSSLRYQQ